MAKKSNITVQKTTTKPGSANKKPKIGKIPVAKKGGTMGKGKTC